MLEDPPQRTEHTSFWSINGANVQRNPQPVPMSKTGPAQDGSTASSTIIQEAIPFNSQTNCANWPNTQRGRLPFVREYASTSSSSKSASNNSPDHTSREQEWRRSLAADLDPIHKESGRSSSRDTASRARYPTRTGAVPIQKDASISSSLHHQQHSDWNPTLPLVSALESVGGIAESSPSSNSSFPHTTTTSATTNSQETSGGSGGLGSDSPLRPSASGALPIKEGARPAPQTWDFEASPSFRARWEQAHANNNNAFGNGTGNGGSLGDRKQATRSNLPPGWALAARRSLSSTGMSSDREAGRSSHAVHRTLSINTDPYHFGAGSGNLNVAQQTFSPGSLRSSSPDVVGGGGGGGGGHLQSQHANTSPPHGLSRLPEGEESNSESDAAATFGNPFAPSAAHQLRHRSTSSAAALQGGVGRDHGYIGRPAFGDTHQPRSASVWANAPLSADIMSGSPHSFSLSQAQTNVRPASFSRLHSDYVHGSSFERGRSTNATNMPLSMQRDLSVGAEQLVIPTSTRTEAFSFTGDLDVPPSHQPESRRHSMAAAVAPLSGQRRAVGFEVTRPVAGSRTSSMGRFAGMNAASEASRNVGATGGAGYGLFGGGSLAISDDDLAADFDALRVNMNATALQRQRSETIDVAKLPPPPFATHDASRYGDQAASLPPGFAGFGSSPSERWPLSARLRDEENVSIWSGESIPSPSGNRRDNGVRGGSGGANGGPSLSARAHSFQAQAGHAPISASASGGMNSTNTSSFEPFGSSKPSLSDHAIASLVTLGPLAPPSGGGGGPTPADGGANLQDLGKGVPLQMLPRDTRLFIVEFKQGRTDLYFRQSQPGSVHDAEDVRKGDLVIVEADRGKDLGSVINDTITVDQVQTFLAQQAELAQLSAAGARPDGVHPAAVTLNRLTRSVNPKRLFAKAGPADTTLLHAKAQDEERALTLCSTKVNQRGLPMTVVAAEMQWDRRKLTFYYTATQRVDFRDLVKELFRLYKTRIWMCHLSHPSNATGSASASTNANANANVNANVPSATGPPQPFQTHQQQL